MPLASVLAVTTGVPGLAPIQDVQSLLSHMTGSTIFLHQIPRAADVCQKYLLDQYPWLETARPSEAVAGNPVKLAGWVTRMRNEHGQLLRVNLLPGDAYTVMDPIVEFTERMAVSRGAGLAGSDA
jgi:hypothetical protein